MSDLFRTKSVEQSIQDTDEPGHKLKRTLSAWDLTIFGVAVVIGAGIFTLTARVAATTAGPAVSIAFVISADRLRAGRHVLRGVRLDGARRRVGVHVLLRHPR